MKEEMMIPYEKIDRAILLRRGRKVMLDADLAIIYGVKTKRLNEQVRRNSDRIPKDFLFQLAEEEKNEVVANCNHLSHIIRSNNSIFEKILCQQFLS